MICILKSILGYVILMLVGTNLIGIIVRGIVPKYYKHSNGELWIEKDLRTSKNILLTTVFILITLAYLYALYHYWNILVVVAAVMVMVARLPDLLYEIKTGIKITFRNKPNKFKYAFWNIIGWLALPVLWYAMCKMK